jgi:hypothetical protein
MYVTGRYTNSSYIRSWNDEPLSSWIFIPIFQLEMGICILHRSRSGLPGPVWAIPEATYCSEIFNASICYSALPMFYLDAEYNTAVRRPMSKYYYLIYCLLLQISR